MTITAATTTPSLSAARGASQQQTPSASVRDQISLSGPGSQQEAPRKGNIVAGVALAAIGCGLVAAASVGIPAMAGLPGLAAVPTGTLLNNALRFCGLMAFSGAADNWAAGDDNRTLRGVLLCAGGALGMASAAGAFGHIGGLTSVCMGVGGFLTTLSGISKLSGEKSEP